MTSHYLFYAYYLSSFSTKVGLSANTDKNAKLLCTAIKTTNKEPHKKMSILIIVDYTFQ